MKKEVISLLKSIERTSRTYQEIDLLLSDVEMLRNDVLKSLGGMDTQQKDFVEYMCDTFKELINDGDEIILPDVLEGNYTETQIKHFLNDLIEI